jgi:hypothetical protein
VNETDPGNSNRIINRTEKLGARIADRMMRM